MFFPSGFPLFVAVDMIYKGQIPPSGIIERIRLEPNDN